MPTIDNSSRNTIKSSLKSSGSKVWSATIAKVYRSGGRGWQLVGRAGALLFLRDPTKNDGMYLRLMDVDEEKGGDVIWEHELWVGFEYRTDRPYFHTFESDDCVYGILFADVGEAGVFAKNIAKRIGKIGRDIDMSNIETASIASSSVSTKSSSRFSLRNIFSGSSNRTTSTTVEPPTTPNRSGISELDIGDPVGFRHLGHIGFDPETGTFDWDNIPPRWRETLAASGATKADLQNPETATFIADFIHKQQQQQTGGSNGRDHGREAGRQERRAPPPPPPKRSSLPPPPPPKQRAPPVEQRTNPAPTNQRPTHINQRPAQTQSKPRNPPPAPPPFEDYLNFMDERRQAAAARESQPRPVAPRPAPSGPSITDQLMAGIRSTGISNLKPVEKPDPNAIPSSPSLDAPGDAMAGLLAQALRNRKVAMAHSDSDSDSEWN